MYQLWTPFAWRKVREEEGGAGKHGRRKGGRERMKGGDVFVSRAGYVSNYC